MNCERIKENGEQCKGYAINGSKYCFWHSPEINSGEKKAVRARGGKSNKHISKSDLLIDKSSLNKIEDVVDLLSGTISIIRNDFENTDSLSARIKIANSIAYQTGYLLSAMEKAIIEKKIEELEKMVLKRDHN